ncbi:biotin-dependent carboxyltransferase family protein [Ideonella sp. A 288]|uniref:5-oxoprolinase subunit C family protein n=1 Tax=Ideonella sp. A 288 TaxID=1962181 RepID=UPI000B4B8BE9|nr:biotin-dependent carboxyltransferase family protein [Ideonella sp. A 288]
MSASLEIISPGAMATLQDLGRIGWRRVGVPRSGTLAPALLRIANALVGQPGGTAAIEFFVAGPTLKAVDGPVQLGCAGDFGLTLLRANGERTQLDSWRSVTLRPGDTLRVGAPRGARVGVLAVRGLAPPLVLGSASTYTRAQLGGQGGRALAAGDKLAVPSQAGAAGAERRLPMPPTASHGPIRVVPGPQADHFDAAVLEAFFAAEYQVSADADRMGVRLQGPALAHNARGSEIVSDATVPGSIQVPGNGQPIVLLADGQTAGGYPKIATVASADLPRLAVAPVGSRLRFAPVTVAQAEALAREHEAALGRLLAGIVPMAMDDGIDLDAIYAANLVSGMIDAHDPA